MGLPDFSRMHGRDGGDGFRDGFNDGFNEDFDDGSPIGNFTYYSKPVMSANACWVIPFW